VIWRAAAARALDLAQAYDSKLTVLSVVDFPTRLSGQSQKLVDGIHQAHRKLVVDVTKPALAAQVQAEGIVREGKPYQVIADTARDQKAGLIVMGSHGRTGLKRLLMGSVTERVIGHAPCPVLVVKG
jgi:nucleotide-binding universal stress UspA family protein